MTSDGGDPRAPVVPEASPGPASRPRDPFYIPPGARAPAPPGSRWAPTPRTIRTLRLAAFALAVTGTLVGIGVVWLHLTTDPLADVWAYYRAAQRLNAGAPLYPAGADPDLADFYRYPPLLAMVLRPFTILPFHVFAVAWEAVLIAAFVMTLRTLGVTGRTWLAVGILAFPIGFSLVVGQAQVLVTLLLAIGQPWSVALGGQLKLFPVLASLWWLGRRDWQSFGAFIAWSVLFTLLQLVLEPRASIDFLGTLGTEQIGNVKNISPFVLSPWLWAALFAAGIAAALTFARTRWGWPIAVALATLTPPRLLIYMLMSLIAALREPRPAVPESERAIDVIPDAAEAYVRSAR